MSIGIWGVVALGGAVGSVARYGTMVCIGRLLGTGFPFGTLAVNVIGGFVMGILAELAALAWSPSEPMRAFLMVGFLGGYTTFSAFSLDVWLLLDKGLYGPAILYIVASVVLSVAALVAGLTLTRVALL